MSGGLVPSIDFTPLSRLGDTLAKGMRERERRDALTSLGVSPGDPNFLPKLGQTLVGLGDIDGALTVSRLQEAAQDRNYQRSTDARDFAFRQQESARSQSNADRTFDISRQDLDFNRNRQAGLDRLTAMYRGDENRREEEKLALDRQKVAQAQSQAAAKAAEVKALPAELGARVALAQSFLDGVPELRRKVEAGGVTGIWDRAMAETGRGDQGEILRRIRSGSEAIIRNLTGAGMNQEEARARVSQYEPARTDSADTVVNKLDMLTEQLQRIEAEAYRGRGIPANRRGKNPYFEAETAPAAQAGAPSAPEAPANPRMVARDQIPEGRRFRAEDGRIYRRVNGQDVPE
ncbi:hypothetical protein C0214_19680 [Methylobacterium sp. DM1]|nr:hypothetical protein C0214_19680 [Methylobacterium sp. DM1]